MRRVGLYGMLATATVTASLATAMWIDSLPAKRSCCVDINVATYPQLMWLPHVDHDTADQIMEARSWMLISNCEDLQVRVPLISEREAEDIYPLIRCD